MKATSPEQRSTLRKLNENPSLHIQAKGSAKERVKVSAAHNCLPVNKCVPIRPGLEKGSAAGLRWLMEPGVMFLMAP